MLDGLVKGRLCYLAAALAAMLLSGTPGAAEPPYRIAIAGEYPSGYNGLLAREGIPRDILLDYQLLDPQVLRRYDLILVAQLSGVVAEAMGPLLAYAGEGGTLVLEGNATPPESLVPGARGRIKNPPAFLIGGSGNWLAGTLGEGAVLPVAAYTHYLNLESENGIEVLARFQARVSSDGTFAAVSDYSGTPAIWSRPVGKGLLVYSGPGIGFSLALQGPEHEVLADALIQHLSHGRLEPQFVPEGQRFGRKQSAASLGLAAGSPRPDGKAPAEQAPASPAAQPLPADAQPIEGGEECREFNLQGSYAPGRGRAEMLLDYRSPIDLVRIVFDHGRATLARTEDGLVAERATVPLGHARQIPFLIRARQGGIVLAVGERRAFLAAAGSSPGRVGTRGRAFSELSLQPVEPISFSDDFMRSSAESGPWSVVSGNWSTGWCSNPDLIANPFSYTASATGPGFATAGYPFWDDYELQAAVKPTSAAGAVGLAVYWQDAKSLLLFRAQVRATTEKLHDGLEVVRVKGGKERVLARRDGCLVRGQWYRLSAQVKGRTFTASVDGVPLMQTDDSTFLGGMAALHVSDTSALFDDVRVRPAEARPLGRTTVDNGTARFAGSIDVDSWAAPATQWDPDREARGLFWRRGRFFGDLLVNFRLLSSPASGSAGAPTGGMEKAARKRMTLLLTREGDPSDAGYALIAEQGEEGVPRNPSAYSAPSATPAPEVSWRLEIRRRDVVVARWDGLAGGEPVIGLQRVGSRLVGSVDGRPVVEYADRDPLVRQWRLGFRVDGFRPRLSGLRVEGDRILDYTFDQAPTDWWVGSGTWELSNRWSCTPEWSWFGGTSSGVAAVWNKWQLCGDVTLDFYVGPRMVERGPGRAKEVCHNFNAVLCGDGRDVTQGYSFVVGQGEEGAVARLSRNGQVVARSDAFRFYTSAHNRWFNVRVEKCGAEMTLRVEEQRILSWTDPAPLQEGYAGIWTRDNGVLLPRVTFYYQGATGRVLSVQ